MTVKHRRMAALVGAVAGIATLTACSGSSDSSSTSPSPAMSSVAPSTAMPTTSAPTASPAGDPCSSQSIAAALPQGSEVLQYDCADVSGTQWAAARVDPGPTVFFLQWNNGMWDVSEADEVCGTASAGLPPKLLDYCDSAAGSTSPS